MSSTQNRTLAAVTGGGQRFIYGPFGVQGAAEWVPPSDTERLGATHAERASGCPRAPRGHSRTDAWATRRPAAPSPAWASLKASQGLRRRDGP